MQEKSKGDCEKDNPREDKTAGIAVIGTCMMEETNHWGCQDDAGDLCAEGRVSPARGICTIEKVEICSLNYNYVV